MDGIDRVAVERDALARNDRYLLEFVEAWNLCPWAKYCREAGRLQRRVLFAPGGELDTAAWTALVDEAHAAVCGIEALPAEGVEVALLIFPALDASLLGSADAAHRFERLARELRERMRADHAPRDPIFHCVAFHPDLPGDAQNASRTIQFIRRSPDPTIQLVRVSVLDAVRGKHPGGSTFVDASKHSLEELAKITPPEGVSDKIARVNHETVAPRRDELSDQLDSLRKG